MRKGFLITIELTLLLGSSTLAVQALAGPGDGAIVIVDQPDAPDVLIVDLREENTDATMTPVKVRVSVPSDAKLRWARLTAYLTASLASGDQTRIAETTVELGPQWANRSVIVEVPAPGEGEYFVRVQGELRLAEQSTSTIINSTSTRRVRFGVSQLCQNFEEVPLSQSGSPCPLLFDTKSWSLDSKNRARRVENHKIIKSAAAQINDLCASDSLHRVSVRGWASPKHSDNPINEVLAQERAEAVLNALRKQAPDCQDRLHNDSEPGTLVVTMQFGEREQDNQCAQIQIARQACTPSADGVGER